MNLFLVQHAEAKSKEADPERLLSDQGRADIQKVAAFLGGSGLQVHRILHSGKLRARQTAETLAEHLAPSGSASETDGLAPLDDPSIWEQRLTEIDEDLVLVGHLPHLGKLAALLLTGDSERSVVAFQLGGVVSLGRDEAGHWSVRWMVVPEILT